MQFPKQMMNEAVLRKSKVFKAIEDSLDGLEVVEINDNSQRKFKIPATNISAIVYDLVLTNGAEIELYVMKDGKVGRVSFNGHAGGDKTLASIKDKDEDIDATATEIARAVLRANKTESLKEHKGKLNKRAMEKLLDKVDNEDDEEISRLTELKSGLKKGSGKFIALNDKLEFHGVNGWTSKQSEIVIFDTEDEARKTQNTDKVVKI